jgi:hypothetical protein
MTIRGVYQPSLQKGQAAKFVLYVPEDFGEKIPLQQTQGQMIPDKVFKLLYF